MIIDEVDYVEHSGVKGMKWGVHTARKEVASVGKSARQIRRQAKRASTPAERRAAAKRYEKEVVNRIKSKEFKDAYQAANNMTKGEMAVHVIAVGPLAALTIPAMRSAYSEQRAHGQSAELGAARSVLRELRQSAGPSASPRRAPASRPGVAGFDRPATGAEVDRAVAEAVRAGV